jgi:HEAT repeat protein
VLNSNKFRVFVIVCTVCLTGCAEGPLWKAGRYLPWVQAKWRAEEAIAETVHSKRATLGEIAKRASRLSESEKEQAVAQLAPFIQDEKIIQVRVDALYTLGEINNQSAETLIIYGLKDPEAEVRIAAINALALRRTPSAGEELIRVIGADTDKDVRATAIRNLEHYPGDATVEALAQVLNEPETALQYAAMKSLDSVTGSSIGINVSQWKEVLASRSSNANSPESSNPSAANPGIGNLSGGNSLFQ